MDQITHHRTKIINGIAAISLVAACILGWQSCTVKKENANLQLQTARQAATIDSSGHIIINQAYTLRADSITILHYHTCVERLHEATQTYIVTTTQIFDALKTQN